VPVFRASRVWDLGRFDEQNRKLLDHAQQLIAGTLP
jgi:hypothetical protein